MVILGAALAASPRVEVQSPWIRLFPTGNTITAYFTISNPSEEPDRLLAVTTPIASRAGLYRTQWHVLSVSYQAVDALIVAGYGRLKLRPGGYFVRIEGAVRPFTVGERLPLTLKFERSGQIDVSARVSNQLLGNR
jgi:periplasmic copper chaperone A